MAAVLALLLAACAPSAVATLHGTPVEPPTGAPAEAVAAADQQATDQDNPLGIAVLDRATGEFAVGEHGQQPMYSASLSKVVVAVELLERHRVTPQDRFDLRRALGPSDDEAMNALWERYGGPSLITSAAARMHLQHTRAPGDQGRWGDTVTTARDMAAVFQHLLSQMPSDDRDFVLDALHAAPGQAADGVNQKFGLMALNAHAVKNGWMCCQQGKVWVHSAGVVDPDRHRYVVALLSSQPSDVGYGKAVADITEVSGTALSRLP
ncbi:serine hydrolase [Saccharopolyspora dendranthemae]|uniref:Beta-lactamase family protein n=1 Tax=Saccharopolyspora dendranthemae TaxID=1181886 RepID=A0A561U3S3_9PSEU|nr:serine hydrolase [Saccharopolyspora dendranthemae]TWF94012.1 beta-lactamase family protein [Saccharopolyspora dendranthemae]